jgi:uncharacterized protein with FMN-binding domain
MFANPIVKAGDFFPNVVEIQRQNEYGFFCKKNELTLEYALGLSWSRVGRRAGNGLDGAWDIRHDHQAGSGGGRAAGVKQFWTKRRKVAAACAGAVVLGCAAYYAYIFVRYKDDIERLKTQTAAVDLAGIADGSYFGDCNVDFIRASVRVDMAGGRIVAVYLLEHYNDRGAPANVIPQKIVAAQRIGVDVVTGATASSKVIQEAVYNALTGKRTIRE